MNILSHHPLRLALLATLIAAPSAAFAIFTGPTSAYYLDNYVNGTIYVVQGNAVINSFATSYATAGAFFQEGNLAVTNVVTTTGFGSAHGSPSSGGQYTLAGVPTGSSNVQQLTPGFSNEQYYDGTSNGQHNYTVQYYGLGNSGNAQEYVIQSDLNWQNPIALFAVEAQGVATIDIGISYDSLNNSLWVSGWGNNAIRDFSMTGTLLSSFSTNYYNMAALAFDNLDNTLWFNNNESNTLVQYDTNGNLLQSGNPTGLLNNYYLAGEFSTTGIPIPEPAITSLLALGLAALSLVSRRRSTIT